MPIIAVEGTIGAGKTTFLKNLSNELKNSGIKHGLLCEPVSEWRSFGPSQQNLLREMYHDPKAYSFDFQLVALLTKCEQVANQSEKILLIERTIGSQLNVFLPILKENNSITNLEFEICSRFMVYLSSLETHSTSFTVYIRVSPVLAKERIIQRGRIEEKEISAEYLQKIHQKYEDWLSHAENVLVLDSESAEQESKCLKEILLKIKNW